MDQSIRTYIAELLGTFALVFIGTAVAVLSGFPDDHGPVKWLEISFAFGGTLMVLVWVIGPVSGCHLNPAVTIPMALSGRFKWSQVPGYVIAQVLGGIAASAVLLMFMYGFGEKYEPIQLAANGNAHDLNWVRLVGWELILTAMFVFTIFAATRDEAPPGFAALAIGGFLFLAHMVGAQLGDASLNPARSIGPALLERGGALGVLWVFIVGPIAGGILGMLFYKLVYKTK